MNSGEYASAKSENEGSLVGTAAGFAIAMLPRLFSDPDTASLKSEEDKTQLLTDDSYNTAVGRSQHHSHRQSFTTNHWLQCWAARLATTRSPGKVISPRITTDLSLIA